jgi:hypothetical protein
MGRYIKIFLVVLCLFAAIFTAQAWAMGGGGHHEGGGHHDGGHGGGHGGGVPEIDPGMAVVAIALLSCGVLILVSKKKK